MWQDRQPILLIVLIYCENEDECQKYKERDKGLEVSDHVCIYKRASVAQRNIVVEWGLWKSCEGNEEVVR